MELRQSLQLKQQLKLTPELQQAIKLLQLTRLELATLVQEELAENPVLEELPSSRPEEVSVASIEQVAETQREESESGVVKDNVRDDDFDWRKVVEEQRDQAPLPSNVVRRNEDLPPFDANLTREEELAEHLLWQLRMLKLTSLQQEIGVELILNVDDNGYLGPEVVESLAEEFDVTPDIVVEVLGRIQRMDPVGCGAQSLEQCLSIQAEVLYPDDDLLQTVILSHLRDLVGRGILNLAQKLGVTHEELEDTRELITTLDPKPGRNYGGGKTQYVVPDVYVRKENDGYVVFLNDDGLPKLRIGSYYKNLLDKKIGDDTKDYLKKKVRSALWFLKSIHQRQNTIRLVAESIVRKQGDFFDHGVSRLKPLVLREVADDIGMHESTVSRVTSNKYMYTPQGLYSMKFFFNPGIQSNDGGDDLASQAVKERIKGLVGAEDPTQPLSDQSLVSILKEEGITIARRTVAKYRNQLGLLSSSKRVRLGR